MFMSHDAAVQFIYSGNADLRMSDAPATTPWCLYLAVLTIYVYGTLHDGSADFSDLPFVFRPDADIRIEPSLARRNALAYIDRLLGCGSALMLPQMPHKNTCGGVIAYAVHLINAIDWGIRKFAIAWLYAPVGKSETCILAQFKVPGEC